MGARALLRSLMLIAVAGCAAQSSASSSPAQVSQRFHGWCMAQKDPTDSDADQATTCGCLQTSMQRYGVSDTQTALLLLKMEGLDVEGAEIRRTNAALIRAGMTPMSAAQAMSKVVPSDEEQQEGDSGPFSGINWELIFGSCGQIT